MSTRTLLFSVAAQNLDGSTVFSLPDPLPAPGANGIITIPVTSPLGRLNQTDPVFRSLVGQGGYWLRSLGVNSQTADVVRLLIGMRQPDPTLLVGGATIFGSDPIFVGSTTPAVQGVPYIRRGPYVPAGWSLCFYGDDGGGTLELYTGELVIELETLPLSNDAARAIKATEFPTFPTVLTV